MTEKVDTAVQALADIALLDDDLDFRTYLEDFLKDEGIYTVRAFSRPGELFDACEERLPDIVLLDMKMGDVSGDKVLEQLLARWPSLCAIVITGYPSLEDMRVTFKLKVFDYYSAAADPAAYRADAKELVAKFHPFAASWYAPASGPEPLLDELTQLGVVNLGAQSLGNKWFSTEAPYAWTLGPQGGPERRAPGP